MIESKFSTNLNDAFNQNNPMYKKVDNNDQRLTDKYLQGKVPNKYYDLKMSKMPIKYKKTDFPNASVNLNLNLKNESINKPQLSKSYNFNNNKNDNSNNIILEKSAENTDLEPKFS